MEDVLRIAIGPALSLVLFVVGYRRTVGARKERAHAAELEVERLMVRRVIVDQYTPTWDDLARLVARKARQHRVKASDLATESDLLTAIYTEILENEFVAHVERETLLQRIDTVIHSRDLDGIRRRTRKLVLAQRSIRPIALPSIDSGIVQSS